MGVRVKQVKYPELEKAIEPYYTSHGVRLDVYLKDENRVIDVELQSHPQKALGKRMRYYQPMVDCDSLMKGQPYTKLKESYILFICKFDPFHDEKKKGYGLPRYTFKNTCAENNLVNLDDKTVKVVYNTAIAPFWQGNYPLALSRALSMLRHTRALRIQKSARFCDTSRPTSQARTSIQSAFPSSWRRPRKTKNSERQCVATRRFA